jgi:hypothetical protein
MPQSRVGDDDTQWEPLLEAIYIAGLRKVRTPAE